MREGESFAAIERDARNPVSACDATLSKNLAQTKAIALLWDHSVVEASHPVRCFDKARPQIISSAVVLDANWGKGNAAGNTFREVSLLACSHESDPEGKISPFFLSMQEMRSRS